MNTIRFKENDSVLYQGEEVRITDSKPKEDRWRIAFNHGTHTTFKWVSGDEINPLVEHVPLAGGTELESPLNNIIVIVRHDGLLCVDGPFNLSTLDELRIFKLQLEAAERLMQERLRAVQS